MEDLVSEDAGKFGARAIERDSALPQESAAMRRTVGIAKLFSVVNSNRVASESWKPAQKAADGPLQGPKLVTAPRSRPLPAAPVRPHKLGGPRTPS